MIYRASNGREGLEKAFKVNPQLIISDIMMPEMDGIELCVKIKENQSTAHIPVILLTAKALDVNKTEGMNTGADMYITKPFNMDYIKSCIESIFRHEEQFTSYIKSQLLLNPVESESKDKNQDEIFLKKVIAIIEKNINNPDLSVEKISNSMGLSSTHLYRKLKEITNQSTIDIIKNYRMQKAAQMIRNNEGNITEIMYAIGFLSLSSFSKSFKSVFNISPGSYADNLKNKKNT
jgi:YesN/AraC family two-component response regulator